MTDSSHKIISENGNVDDVNEVLNETMIVNHSNIAGEF